MHSDNFTLIQICRSLFEDISVLDFAQLSSMFSQENLLKKKAVNASFNLNFRLSGRIKFHQKSSLN